jgi:hypothetical protein
MTRICIKCGIEKPLELFCKGKAYKDGRRNLCKKCHSNNQSEYMKNNPDKYEAQLKRNSYTKANWKRHKITEEDYQAHLDVHDGATCVLCQIRPATDIDHDHNCCPGRFSCGKCVRGVICGNCNKAMGAFKDDPVIVQRVLDYLSQ